MTPVERVLSALNAHGSNVRQNGSQQWTVQCPNSAGHSNGDRNPSLSVSQNTSGAVLVNCHAGCAATDVVASLGLRMSDLFPDDRSNAGAAPIETVYPYVDEHGELLFEIAKSVDSNGRKKFLTRQRGANGEPIRHAQGVRRVLFNLPQVLAAVSEGRPVVICEGEKDAVNAAWLFEPIGAVTTTNPHGAGKWRPEFNECLRDARVIIVGDDDAPGHAHVEQVRAALTGVAATIECWLPHKGHKDVSEHYAAGRTIEQLRPFTSVTALTDVNVSRLPDPVDWHALFRRDVNEDWLVDGLWPRGRQLHIFAARKTGKSLIMLWIAACIAVGRDPFTGQQREPVSVIYLDHEMTEDDLLERLEAMGFEPAQLGNLHYYLLPSMPPLDTIEGGEQLMELVERDVATAVVIDTLSRVVKGEENSNDTFQNFYAYTGRRLKQAGVSLSRLDHEGHEPGRSRGASSKADDVDVLWRLQTTEGGLAFVRKATRISWVRERIDITRTDEPLSFSSGLPSVPEGTKAKADELDGIGAPVEISRRTAAKLLTDAKLLPGTTQVLGAAVNYRKRRAATGLL